MVATRSRTHSASPARAAASAGTSRAGLRRVGITIMCLALSGALVETFVPGGLVRAPTSFMCPQSTRAVASAADCGCRCRPSTPRETRRWATKKASGQA
jgi:hypothetical protein